MNEFCKTIRERDIKINPKSFYVTTRRILLRFWCNRPAGPIAFIILSILRNDSLHLMTLKVWVLIFNWSNRKPFEWRERKINLIQFASIRMNMTRNFPLNTCSLHSIAFHIDGRVHNRKKKKIPPETETKRLIDLIVSPPFSIFVCWLPLKNWMIIHANFYRH